MGYISKQETITINKTSEKSKLPDIGKLYKIHQDRKIASSLSTQILCENTEDDEFCEVFW